MNKEVTEKYICEWLSLLGNTRASSVRLAAVRKLVDVLFNQEHPKKEEGE